MRMRLDETTRSLAALAGLCAIAAGGLTVSCFSDRSTAASASCNGTTVACVVDIQNFAFQPAVLRVAAGATVTWTNREQQAGLGHSSTSDGSGWDSGILQPGATYSRAFAAVGEFPYHCEPHPGMRATIIVE